MRDESSIEYRYWAFVSYKSEDRRWAQWLHQALEHWAVPKSLVQRATVMGGTPIPRRLKPIFLDRDELTASSSLSDALRVALRESRFLIVVCSRTSAKSRHVQMEIDEFRRLGRAERILALIIEDPLAGDIRTVFSPALLIDGEPLAADARPGADGKHNAKLKLIARMLGVPYDDLRRREDIRRRRRQLAAMLAMALVAAVFAVVAWNADRLRREAEEARGEAQLKALIARREELAAIVARELAEDQRLRAEQLIDRLLVDFERQLRPVGRLDLLTTLGEAVLGYYDGIPEVIAKKVESRAQRASALSTVGGTFFSSGQMQAATGAYEESLRVAEGLVSEGYDPQRWQRHHAMMLKRLGEVAVQVGDLDLASSRFADAERSYRSLVESAPSDLAWYIEWRKMLDSVGDMQRAREEWDSAYETYSRVLEAVALPARISPSEAPLIRNLAWAHGNLASVEVSRGRLENALEHATKAVAAAEHLESLAGADPASQQDLASMLERLGIALGAIGRFEEALAVFDRTHAIREAAHEFDRTNTEWQRAAAITCNQRGFILQHLGRNEEGLASHEEAIRMFKDLCVRYPENLVWRADLAASAYQASVAAEALGRPELQRGYRAVARECYQKIVNDGGVLKPVEQEVLEKVRHDS